MRHIKLIAGRELTEAFRSKGYWVTVAVFVLLVAAAIVVPRFFDSETTYHVGLAGDVPAGLTDDLEALVAAFDANLETSTYPDRDAAVEVVSDDEIDVALVFEADEAFLIRRDLSSDTLVGIVNQVAVSASARNVLVDAGLDTTTINTALAPAPPTEIRVDAEESGRLGIGWATGLVLYLAIFMGGMSVASGVAIEKSTRIAEVLVSTVRPTHLLTGKVLGVGLSTLVIVLAGAIPFAAAIVAGWVDVPSAAAIDVVAAVGWFILGYGIYAVAFGAMGALVDRQEDVGTAVGPLSTIVVLSYLGTIVAAGDPNGLVSRIISIIPFSAPMVMPVRIAAGSATWGEVALAVGVGIVTFLVLARVGGVIYRRALLRGGQRLKLRHVLTS